MDSFVFSAQICPKTDLGLEIQKVNVRIRISILKIPCVPIFRLNEQLWLFWPKFAQKSILELEFQKYKSGSGISISNIPCVPTFSQNNFKFLGLNLGRLPNYMRYFGSNNVEGVAESWVEAEISRMELDGDGWWVEMDGRWSWLDVGARFSNIP